MHDLSGRDRDGLTHLEAFRSGRALAPVRAPPILRQVGEAAQEIHAVLGLRMGQDLRVGPDKIRRGHRVEQLAGRKRRHLLMRLAQAVNAGRGGLPPAFGREK